MKRKSILFKLTTGAAIGLAVIAAAFFIYTGNYYKAGELAESSLQSDSAVTVEVNRNLSFTPVSGSKKTGFIFYPGGKVEASAYAPLAKGIAQRGYKVIIAEMPFNLAVFSPNKADRIIADNQDVTAWVVGGHSLGGVMAAEYAYKNDKVRGVVLLASYPQSKRDFRSRDMKVLSLWGSNDLEADIGTVKNAKSLMPSGSVFEEISGGNHSSFGDYGLQKGDGAAVISGKEQMDYASQAIVQLLESITE